MQPDDLREQHRDARRRWAQLQASGDAPSGARVLVAASFTAKPIEAGLGVALLDDTGLAPLVTFADHNQLFQVCLHPAQHGAHDADEIVLLWRIEDVFERDLLLALEGDRDAEQRIADGAARLADAVASLVAAVTANVVVSDAPMPIGFGLDHDDDETVVRLVALQAMVNRVVDERLASITVSRLRLSAMQVVHGTQVTFDRRTWLLYRQPFADWFATAIGARIAQVVAARTRVAPKVLVLDCDGTLWGGIAADDGIGALECSDAFPGFAYRSFQLAARRLRHRGVLLALASKNEPETVVEAFDTLDGMALSEHDIAARRVNWLPKPQNLESLAAELNLGLDSFVFVDDSDHELGAMAAQLPMVRCLKVPDDLEAVPDLLAESGWFRLMRTTADDEQRTARVIAEESRSGAARAMSHDDYLASLQLSVRMVPVTASNLGRVTQLVNKTNQFNVTTLRRTEADIARLVADPAVVVRCIEVDDVYGEYGIVGVAIVRCSDDHAVFDSFLMSCRVLGRGVETAFLAMLVSELRDRGIGTIEGRYAPTAKNALVADLFPRHGFESHELAPETNEHSWVLPAEGVVELPSHIRAAVG
jgi:FkbH-like protein